MVIAVPLALIGLALAVHYIHISRLYVMEAEYEVMPDNDAALIMWLQSQPGVVAHDVWVSRKGNTLQVSFIMVQNIWNQPPTPEVETRCGLLGYSGMNPRFRFVDN